MPGTGPKVPIQASVANPAAERLAIEKARAETVEEAQVHRAPGEEAVGSRIVEGQDGLRAMGTAMIG